jgi:hypothetical protein
MEAAPNECCMCYEDIKPGEEYHQCTNPLNDKNPHKVCKTCHASLKKGYDYDEEILDPQAIVPSPRLDAHGNEMYDAFGQPIIMSAEELIAFYKTQKHASHGEGCPIKDGGNLVKKTMKQPVTLRVMDKPAAAAVSGFARGGHDYDDDFNEKQLQQALHASFQLSRPRPSGPGAAVRRQEQGAAAAAPEPEDRYLAAALLASTRETETPIQQIHRELNRRGIQVSEEDVRRIFQQMSRLYPENDYRAIRETENYFVANPPPPPPSPFYPPPPPSPFYPPPPRYDYQTLQRVVNRVREELRVKEVSVEEERLRSSVRNMLEHEPNEDIAVNSVVQLFTQPLLGGKKSKIIKSRRGKKSKMTKSRKGKKSKIIKSRRGKKSKMTRKKV